MNKVYRIKPLEWEGEINIEAEWGSLTATTVFGSYDITTSYSNESDFICRYCFDEYYDEGKLPCNSIEEGKRLTEAHWMNRIIQCLKEEKFSK